MNCTKLYDLFGEKSKYSEKEMKLLVTLAEQGKSYPPETENWFHSCYHEPNPNEKFMDALNHILEGYGIEGISEKETKNRQYIEYINFGDPYVPTIVYCKAWKNPIRIEPEGYAGLVK